MEHDNLDPIETEPKILQRRPPPPFGVYAENPHTARRAFNSEQRKKSKSPEFVGRCGAHGETLFDTRTGACLVCLSLAAPDIPPRLAYMSAGATLFPIECAEHGPGSYASVRTRVCVLCQSERQSSSPARARARRNNETTYHDECERCGTHEHYVSNGKCSACFTTMGVARVGQRSNPERIAARAAGLTKYQDDCDIHGRTDHHTIRGKCLQCFNSLGQPRKRK